MQKSAASARSAYLRVCISEYTYMVFIETIRRFKKFLSGHKPLIEIFISGENLLHNLGEYARTFPALGFIPVLKSNAYGHGLEQVLKVLKNRPQPLVAVDSFFEAQIVKRHSPFQKVLVIDYARLENYRQPFHFALTGFENLREVAHRLKKKVDFHLKVDTGLHRQGILPEQFENAAELMASNPNIRLKGLFSHLAEAESADNAATLRQIAAWNDAVKYFKSRFPGIEYRHLSASAGVRFSDKIDANYARLGIGFYGFNLAHDPGLDLRLALEMKTVITGTKNLPAGESVGYGFTFKTSRSTSLVTIPVGYFEGLDRRLSNLGSVKVKGVLCPIVGRISMNIASIDVSAAGDLALEETVQVISADKKSLNSVENMARLCNTIPYEILVHIPAHLKRTVV